MNRKGHHLLRAETGKVTGDGLQNPLEHFFGESSHIVVSGRGMRTVVDDTPNMDAPHSPERHRASKFDRLDGNARAYAPTDGFGNAPGLRAINSALNFGGNPAKPGVAVYDISGHTMYMPDGSRMEVHSGLGPEYRDKADPNHVRVRMQGAMPPGVYDLSWRGGDFHGEKRAIRFNPEGSIYGRGGLLGHPDMMGPDGDSNGCASFKKYDQFADAFAAGQVKKVVAVDSLANHPDPAANVSVNSRVAGGWSHHHRRQGSHHMVS
jgi:hypothetical protein